VGSFEQGKWSHKNGKNATNVLDANVSKKHATGAMNRPRENSGCGSQVKTMGKRNVSWRRLLWRDFADGDKTDGGCWSSLQYIPPERIDEFRQIGRRTVQRT